MEAIYGMHGQERDALTNYSTPASGSFYFAPSVDALDAAARRGRAPAAVTPNDQETIP